jgi:hypothetical protein
MSISRVVAPPGSKDIVYGHPPYGWRISKDRSKVVRDRYEQRVIAVIRHMSLVRGLSIRKIIAELNEMGIVNRRGKPFPFARVWEIVHGIKEPAADTQATKRR